jgi:hypothetical protein
MDRLAKFAENGGKVLLTGESGAFDGFFLRRPRIPQRCGFVRIDGTPEAIDLEQIDRNSNYGFLPPPAGMEKFLEEVAKVAAAPFTINGGDFVAAELAEKPNGDKVLFLLNYDNANPVDLEIKFSGHLTLSATHSPAEFGAESVVLAGNGVVSVEKLNTFTILEMAT